MLEDQVAILLQRYLGDYVIGLNKEALKISVWKGDVELTNMQLRPEALNALKLPVNVKAGFLGSVKLKVPWNRLGQVPVLVDIDRIFVLAEPATQVEGCTEDSVQEAKKFRVQEMERKLLEKAQQLKSEVNKSWLGSLIDTIIGNLKLSISNIHIRYEDLESNPGHAFSAGVTLDKLSAVTVDNKGTEAFVTGGALDRIQKTVELECLALYLDSDITPWHASKPWEDLHPLEWDQFIRTDSLAESHTYILQPVTGNAKYSKLRRNGPAKSNEPLQKAVINLDDVTMCLSKDAYIDILKLADNFAAFNQRLKYAHYRPMVSVKHDPRSWWKYACKSLSDQLKMTSGKLSWEHVLRYATLRKKYISLYASLLKADPSQAIVIDNKDIEELDREIDIDLILQWRMLAHKFVEQAIESAMHSKQQKKVKSWWSFGWSSQSVDSDPFCFTGEDWERLNKVIGYKEGNDDQILSSQGEGDVLHTSIEIHMKHNASKLATDDHQCVAELSCDSFSCSIRLFSETKVFDMNLGSYRLSSPNGLLAESATDYDSLVGVFSYKPFDSGLDWSVVAKASPCYMTYLKASIDQIIHFFESNTVVSQTVALETAAAVQMTINEVKRTARQQVNRVLKDHTRFLLDLDIAAPKITIPSNYCPDNCHFTNLMLDLGNLLISSQDDCEANSANEMEMYIQFNLILNDVSAFLVDGDYPWGKNSLNSGVGIHSPVGPRFWPVIDKCGLVVKLQQIRVENPSYPATRLAVRLPSLVFHFSPARYHRLMQVANILKKADDDSDFIRPWDQADFGGWLFVLAWKGVANREAVWQRRYLCLVGPFLYILKNPGSKSYNQFFSLQGKQVYRVSEELIGGMDNVLAVCDATISKSKVVEDANAVILQCTFDDLRTWQSRLQGAVYRASGSTAVTSLYETSSSHDGSEGELVDSNDLTTPSELERVLLIGVLDELKILFSYSQHHDENFAKVLLAKERHLFEFRAKGGQVELSIRSDDMFIVTLLKSLEIEDLVFRKGASQPCYLARSFIQSVNSASSSVDAENQNLCVSGLAQSDGDENFFEAAEDLVEHPESGKELPGGIHEFLGSRLPTSSKKLSIKPPSFVQTARLLTDDAFECRDEGIALTDTLDSFVKAQIVIIDQRSPRYDNTDKKVILTLTTLAFFCRRPTILAIMDFANAINADDDESSLVSKQPDVSKEGDSQQSTTVEEAVVKGLLGKGRSRILFSLSLNMAHAQILLMKENETKLATLLQENLRANIMVYPSSFGINASLGNLKISDDSLHIYHLYYWICDMRDPGGSSFVQLVFNSFSVDDEDYEGYEYSLFGQFSEVRIVYLNRFVQEIICYFTGLVPNNANGAVKLRDQVTNSEKWFTTSEIKGSAAVKLDLSLRMPIILMPRKTDSLDYLKLDVVHITIKNIFQWSCGSNDEMSAVHVEIMTILVEDINLCVGTATELGDSIIQGVKGISVVVSRSLRDLLHQIPNTEVAIKMLELKASLSNKEYQIITECTLSNISEAPNLVPPLNNDTVACSIDVVDPVVPLASGSAELKPQNDKTWTALNVSVVIDLIELSLHSGVARDVFLATLQVSGAWLLYKSNTNGESYISATLKGFTVIDDREGVEQQFRLAVGKPAHIGCDHLHSAEKQPIVDAIFTEENNVKPVPTMLILDAKFGQSSTSVSLCIQRPQLLVALDFLLAFVEFFVPTVGSMLLNEDDENSVSTFDAIILDQSTYNQPTPEFSLSPRKFLVVDNENFDHFIYDGKGGTLHLQDSDGRLLSASSIEPMIFVGNRKRLQFKNVFIRGGRLLGSCILLGINSSFSASEDDQVFFEKGDGLNMNTLRDNVAPFGASAVSRTSELILEIQAVGPELTFFNTSKDVGKSLILSNKLLHAQFDAFCRVVLKGDTTEMNANALGLTMESNGIRILEPLDVSIKLSNASGKTNIHFDVSDVFFNLSFSILRLCLALEEDILAFLRMTSKKMTVVCSEFDKVGTIENQQSDQIYAFWRPRAPPGFAVLGDYLTALDKPPTKGVLAVNTSFVNVKKAVSFKQIWPPMDSDCASNSVAINYDGMGQNSSHIIEDGNCSIWFPVAPAGYVALGCVVSTGRRAPLLSSAHCILASLVSPGDLRDCIAISSSSIYPSKLAFWRVDNAVGTFLPADPSTLCLACKAYELRHIFFQPPKISPQVTIDPDTEFSSHDEAIASEKSSRSSGCRLQAIASFKLIWWNQGSRSSRKLSIWRPVVPQGMVYFGDIAVEGFESPRSCVVLHLSADDLYRAPLDFQFVGKINKHRGTESISFWLPVAPLGFVSMGCVACRSMPKKHEFSSIGCMRSDMVGEDHFFENSVWDTSAAKIKTEPLSIWAVANELGTFVVRNGYERPHKRFALKLADPKLPSGSDDIVIDAEIRTLSLVLFDDYGGLMVPLCNVFVSGIGFSTHGRTNFLNSTVSFSLAARSYNDKHDAWEPLVEPVDGFIRYQYDLCAPGATSQLHLTTRDLKLNISVSNANTIFQGYASWNNVGDHVHGSGKKHDMVYQGDGDNSIANIHHRHDFTIIPQNKLGQDIFVCLTETSGESSVIRMTSGDTKALIVPVSKNMLDSHMKGILSRKQRTLVAIIIADAELPEVEELSSHQFIVAVRLTSGQHLSNDSLPDEQSARTCGNCSDYSSSSRIEMVKWNEVFFFKVDSLECYMVELVVTDTRNGEPIGYFSAPLKEISRNIQHRSQSDNYLNDLTWIQLSTTTTMNKIDVDLTKKSFGRIKCAIFFSPPSEAENNGRSVLGGKKSGFIQISPTREGPWTTMRLNYAAPSACWQFGDVVVASEVRVKDGNKYLNIRSLVSIRNNTDILLDVCLKPKICNDAFRSRSDADNLVDVQINQSNFETKEFFETEIYDPCVGWVEIPLEGGRPNQAISRIGLHSGWEWVDDWSLDKGSVTTADGWIYAPGLESLKWPQSYNSLKFVNYVRQRRWVRTSKQILDDVQQHISVGPLKPGNTLPLPLSSLMQSGLYTLQLKPLNINNTDEFSWSSVVDRSCHLEDPDNSNHPEICVSNLTESHNLLHCTQIAGNPTNHAHGLWFCLDIQATEITKDIHSRSVEDWTLVVKSPLSITNYLPMAADFSILTKQPRSDFVACTKGILFPGKAVNVLDTDLRNPLYFSLLPQGGWLPIHESVIIYHPSKASSKSISLRSSISGRIIHVVLEQNHDSERPLLSKIIRLYAPYWFSIARCPPLTYKILNLEGRKQTQNISIPFISKKNNEVAFTEVTEEDMYDGYTIDSALNFRYLGMSVSINHSGNRGFGPVSDLSPLSEMDGSLDLNAYDADGKCMRLFVSSKPCPYQSVPTKVICIRPLITFTNRMGQGIFIKLSAEDEPKLLHPFDSRVSFLCHKTDEPDKLQVRLEDTEWSYPIEVKKEDTLFMVTRKPSGIQILVRTEIRGYEEGSRFVVVFRIGSAGGGPIRFENTTSSTTIGLRQSGFDNSYWIQLIPQSTTIFSWDDPYGKKCIDVEVNNGDNSSFHMFDLEYTGLQSPDDESVKLQFCVLEVGNRKVARFTEDGMMEPGSSECIWLLTPAGGWEISRLTSKEKNDTPPMKIIVEFGVFGVSIIDHKPKELCYLHLERVFMSYLSGYDGGTTNRFKLILGYLQLDNQLPLTIMPVMLVPEKAIDVDNPVFKITISLRNNNADGVLVFPNFSVQVTESLWRINIDEPIIWAFVDFYANLQLDRLPKSSSVTQVDPEIRIDIIDVSEVRLKVSLETAPGQRPVGALGVWGPILSAVGNALKIQVHLRKVMHRNRFMRRSSVIPAIGNRIWKDLIHNPLHLIFSLDVFGMTSSTLSSLSKGFAELSTDGQFLQLRTKQVRTRKISGIRDGFLQGTEALAQGVVFGVSGVVTKPIDSARQNGILGLAHGLGQAFLGFIVQPVSGALDFFSLTVNGIGASCSKCLEMFKKNSFQRIRIPRAIRANGILTEYCEREALGQMILYLAEASRDFGCTEIFKEPSKYAWSDYYEEHFSVPYKRIMLVTNKRVALLQCSSLDAMDKKPCKIMWDVSWDELMALELAKAGSQRPCHLILHLKNFKRSEPFARVIKCCSDDDSEGSEQQAVRICFAVRKIWKQYLSDLKCVTLMVPSNQRSVSFACLEDNDRSQGNYKKSAINSRELSLSATPACEGNRFVNHSIDFQKIWSSDLESTSRCTLCQKQVSEQSGICTIWRPVCPDGYVSIGDVAHVGIHPPHVSTVYRYIDHLFSLPLGYDLVWRNCLGDYASPVSIWVARPPPGFVSMGCVGVAGFVEPEASNPPLIYCVAESLAEEWVFEEQKVWMAPDSYPWACHIYQVQSDALHFVALRQTSEDSGWKPMRVVDPPPSF